MNLIFSVVRLPQPVSHANTRHTHGGGYSPAEPESAARFLKKLTVRLRCGWLKSRSILF